MNRSIKVTLLVFTLLGIQVAYAGFKSKPFVPPSGESIKTIGLLKIGEPRGYFLGEGGGPGGASQVFGLGGLMFEQFKKPKHPEYANAGFHFSAEAERLLTAHLKAAGFNVIVVPVERKKPYQLVDDYKALSVPNVDAYLDVAPGGVGYRKSTFSAFPGAARKVGPIVGVVVQLVSARTKKVLYAETLEYGWRKATAGNTGVDIEAPDDHIFKNVDALETDLMSGAGSRSLTQLVHGIDLVMRQVVSAFSSYPGSVAVEQRDPRQECYDQNWHQDDIRACLQSIATSKAATGRSLQAGATPGKDSPIDIAKAAPAATPSPGGAIQEGTVSTAYKIAIFPFDGSTCVGRNRPSDEKFAAELGAFIERNDRLALAYSYYDQSLNQPPLEKRGRLWKESKPNLTQVYTLGESRGVDAVVMYWRPAAGLGYCTDRMPPFPIEVYVIDVKQQKTYRIKGREKNINALAEQALSKYLSGAQSKVVATAPVPATAATSATIAKAAPTKRDQVKRSQTASAGGPFEGITLRPGGSVEAINAAAEAYCGSLNKKSRLIAAPPNNPDYVFQCYQPRQAVPAPAPSPRQTIAKAAPAIQKRAVATAYKIAIPPFGDDAKCIGISRRRHEELAPDVAALIKRNPSMQLIYSHYDQNLNHPPIEKPERLWKGSKPNLAQVYALAETHGVDAVVMYWRPESSPGVPQCSARTPPYEIHVYVIDVKERKTYRLKGREQNHSAIAEQALSGFLTGRR
jgi:hypothetical protein